MTITLTPDIERAVTQRAARQGTTPELLALNDLRGLYAEEPAIDEPAVEDGPEDLAGKTLADVLKGRTGTRASGQPSRLSEDEHSFADHLAQKRAEGRL